MLALCAVPALMDASHAGTGTVVELDPVRLPGSGAATFSGTLLTGYGEPVQGREVGISRAHPWLGWLGLREDVLTLETDPEGAFSGTAPAAGLSGTREFYAEFGGDAEYGRSEGSAGIAGAWREGGAPGNPAEITLEEAGSAYAGDAVRFAGRLSSGGAPLAGDVEIRAAGRGILGSGSSDWSGAFSIRWIPGAEHVGTVEVYAAYPGAAGYPGARTEPYVMDISERPRIEGVEGTVGRAGHPFGFPPTLVIEGGTITDVDLERENYLPSPARPDHIRTVLTVHVDARDGGKLEAAIPQRLVGGYPELGEFSARIDGKGTEDITAVLDNGRDARVGFHAISWAVEVGFPAGAGEIAIEHLADLSRLEGYEILGYRGCGQSVREDVNAAIGPGGYYSYTVPCDGRAVEYSLSAGGPADGFAVYMVGPGAGVGESAHGELSQPRVCGDPSDLRSEMSGRCHALLGSRIIIANPGDRHVTVSGTIDTLPSGGSETPLPCESTDARYQHRIDEVLEPDGFVYYSPLCSEALTYHITTASRTGAFATFFLPHHVDPEEFAEKRVGALGDCESGRVWYDRSHTCDGSANRSLLIANVEDRPITLEGWISS